MGKSSSPRESGPDRQERALARTGAQRWNRFVNDFVPGVHESVNRARPSASDYRDVEAAASAEAATEVMNTGVDIAQAAPGGPGSGAFRAQIASESDTHSEAVGLSRAAARPAFAARESQALLSAAAQGRGLQGLGSTSAAEAGWQATNAGIGMTMQRNENAGNYRRGLISGAAGAAGMYGQSRGWFDPNQPAPGAQGGRSMGGYNGHPSGGRA